MAKARAVKSDPKKPVKISRGSSSTNGTKASSDMKATEIRDLIDFISKTGLNEVDIETSELKLHVKREPDQKVLKSSAPVMAAPAAPAPIAVSPAPSQVSAPKATSTETVLSKTTVDIKSPMIGTFYRTGSPEVPPFVSVGDKVSKGQTVCIIEAMKLFNEIESEVSGTIVKVMVENSSPVEYEQVLFVVEPD